MSMSQTSAIPPHLDPDTLFEVHENQLFDGIGIIDIKYHNIIPWIRGSPTSQ
jgi:hypothetical protein